MTTLNRVAVWDERPIEVEDGVFVDMPAVTYFDSRDMRQGETEDDFISRFTNKLKLNPRYVGRNFVLISITDIPVNKTERDSWSFRGGKVVVDEAKKSAKKIREDAKDAILLKIGITKDEHNKLRSMR